MTNLLRLELETARAPKVPRYEPNEFLANKIKKVARYFEKVIDITDSDLAEAAKLFHLVKDGEISVKTFDELDQSDKEAVAWYHKTYHDDKKKVPTKYIYSSNDKNLIVCCLNKLPIGEAGDTYTRRSITPYSEKRDMFQLFPTGLLALLGHIVPESGYQTNEENLSTKVREGREYVRDEVLVPFIAGRCYKKNYHFVLEKEVYAGISKAIDKFAIVEENWQLNQSFRRNSSRTIATVCDDKKYQDQELNSSSKFNQLGFYKVEVDTQKYLGQTFDYDLFKEVERAWEDIYSVMPKASASPELKFRKLGKHKAAGLYVPDLNIVCVDVRTTTSFIHEYGHYLDYKTRNDGNQWSLDECFYPIVEAYRNDLPDDVGSSGKFNRDYYCTPTEIFARGFELWVSKTVTSDSPLLKKVEDYKRLPEYLAFNNIMSQTLSFFNDIFERESQSVAAATQRPARQIENTYIQLSLFDDIGR